MSRRSFDSTALAVVATGMLVAGCSQPVPASTGPDSEVESQLQWTDCPDGVEDPESGPPTLQCAAVPVPLDYADPDGREIEVAISRLASDKPDERRGVLLLNPGGPGGTGLDQPAFLAAQGIPDTVSSSYDLIGMDIRGVGHSAPISCGFTDDINYYGAVPPYAFDDSAFVEQVATSEEVAQRCADNDDNGELRHVTTANIARDLDRVRSALGEDKASFLGYSYGTALGAAYASMFPDTSDRVVLDSNIGDTHLDRDGMRRYAQGMEQTFPDFARWAAERHEQYGLGDTAEAVRDTYFRLAERLDESPVAGLNGRAFRLATFVTLYNPLTYATAAQSWQSLLNPAEAPNSEEPPAPTGGPSPFDNNWSVFLAVTCNDVEWPSEVGAYEQAIEEDRANYPLFGAATANIMPCAFWKYEPIEPPVAVNQDGPANVLVAQNKRDPVTPLRGGELIDEKFGDRSTLLTVDGSGHGVYVLGANECAQSAITGYLVDGIMPAADTIC